MSDTAAFFANKKKKKKAFKGFNANKIDASTVTSTVHVDAPALSTDGDVAAGLSSTLASTSLNNTDSQDKQQPAGDESNAPGTTPDQQWEDAPIDAPTNAAVKTTGTQELMDMKALEKQRNEQDDIAERMRVEETKAALAAAREGMEREAERLKKEKEEAKKGATSKSASGQPRFAAAAAADSASGGKWVPPHLRAGGAASLSRVRMGASTSSANRKVDTQDENLFPDLSTADQIIQEQKQQQQSAQLKATSKKPPSASSTWGRGAASAAASRPYSKPAAAPTPQTEPPKAPEPKPSKATETSKPASTTSSIKKTVAGSKEAALAAGGGLKKKKKKKDVSTFKASS